MWPWPDIAVPFTQGHRCSVYLEAAAITERGKKREEKTERKKCVVYAKHIFLPYFYDAYWHNVTCNAHKYDILSCCINVYL